MSFKNEVSIKDPENPEHTKEEAKGTVEFNHVSFAYPEAGENVLTDIHFKAKKGETVAIYRKYGKRKKYACESDPQILRCDRRICFRRWRRCA